MADVIVLDPIEPGVTPPYCCHGRVTCIACGDWCWLGDTTVEVVKSGRAQPLCLPCANKYVPRLKHQGMLKGHVRDHRREDGPHV